jgi:hypothetical protein
MTGGADSIIFYTWLIRATGELLAHYWPITIAMLGLGVVALTVRSPLRDARFRRRLWILAIPYAAPLVILLIGTVLRYELHGPPHPSWREPPAWYGYALFAVILLQVIASVGFSMMMKGSRLRSAGILLPSVWLSFCAFLPAGLAVAGVGL